MAEKGESSGHQHRPPMTGEFAIPTVSERKEQEKQIQEETQRSADEAFKKRQIDISHEQSVTNRRIATYTLILAILGGLGNGIAVYNSKLSRDVARHAERELEASIAQNRLDQRAWMGLEGIAFDKPQPGKAFPIVIRIRNSGKTPALDVTSIATLEAVGRLSHGPTYNCSDQGDVGKAVIAPNGIWEVRLDGAKTTKSGRCQEFCVNGFRLVDDLRLHWLHLSGG